MAEHLLPLLYHAIQDNALGHAQRINNTELSKNTHDWTRKLRHGKLIRPLRRQHTYVAS